MVQIGGPVDPIVVGWDSVCLDRNFLGGHRDQSEYVLLYWSHQRAHPLKILYPVQACLQVRSSRPSGDFQQWLLDVLFLAYPLPSAAYTHFMNCVHRKIFIHIYINLALPAYVFKYIKINSVPRTIVILFLWFETFYSSLFSYFK